MSYEFNPLQSVSQKPTQGAIRVMNNNNDDVMNDLTPEEMKMIYGDNYLEFMNE